MKARTCTTYFSCSRPYCLGLSSLRKERAESRTWLTAMLSKNMRMSTNRPNRLKQNQKVEPVMRLAA